MPSIINTLIVLSGISAAQAGPLRRYANTTSQISHTTMSTGVAYNPVASIPALSLAPVQGITTLPFSLIAEAAATESPATTTGGVQSFKYEPLDDVTTSFTHHQPASAPTSFWTFGDPNRKSTVTLTSTSIVYEYAQPSSQAGQAAGLQSSQQGNNPYLSRNATSTCSESMSQTSIITHNPIPTNNLSSLIHTTSAMPGSTDQLPSSSTTMPSMSPSSSSSSPPASSSSTTASLPPPEPKPTTSSFAYPYPDNSSPTSAIAQNNDNASPSASSALPMFSSQAANQLPEVVMEGSQTTQEQKQYDSSTALSSSLPPGITIVPAHPSVIYITVTDAGVTTTVTA
jgi:hypothetical protein